MNADVKAKWLAALRSGEYTQGKGKLARKGDGGMEFCCLGVLCEVLRPQLPGLHVEDNYGLRYYGGRDDLLPMVVVEHAGLGSESPKVQPSDAFYTRNLSAINDEGVPFAVIADLIERDL